MKYNNLKVLVVDDDPLVRSLCGSILTRNDFTVIFAENGSEALETYREFEHEIGLTISDIAMPVMDGFALVREIFEHEPRANIILMTGYSKDQPSNKDLERLCAVISKPFTPATLMEVVMDCLAEQNRKHPEMMARFLADS